MDGEKNYTWELPWNDARLHLPEMREFRALFGEGHTAIITDREDKIIAYCPLSSAMDIAGGLRMWHDSAERAKLYATL